MSNDGLARAITLDHRWIITSLNSTTIFKPPMGGDHHLFLRSNLRYGEDNPLQWPQLYVAQYCHIICIPHSPDRHHSGCIMWLVPEITDFFLDDGALGGVGKLNPVILIELRLLSDALTTQAQSSKCFRFPLVQQLTKCLGNLLHHLEFISTSFFTMCRGARELQRVYIELIHPYSALHSIHIKSLKPLTQSIGFFPSEPSSRPTYPSIYRGPGDTIKKYFALVQGILDYLKYPNPFGEIRAKPSIYPLPAAGPAKREIRNQCYTPCKLDVV